MKNILLSLCLVMVSVSFAPKATAADIALRICEYVAANDKNRLRSYLKQHKLKIRKIFNDITCNNQNLLIFSAANNSLEVGEFIIGKTPAKIVKANLDEITKHSAHLGEEARSRVE